MTYHSAQEMEKAQVQYVSGGMFGAFGLLPVLGRLLTAGDDVTPGAHPYAMISYDYWVRRFGKDPNVIGRTFHMGESFFEMGDNVYQIIGVGPREFYRHRARHDDRYFSTDDDGHRGQTPGLVVDLHDGGAEARSCGGTGAGRLGCSLRHYAARKSERFYRAAEAVLRTFL